MIYKKSWKYILIKCSNLYYNPKALKDFGNVKKGDLGGFVQGYRNLSQSGDCWVYSRAIVADDAKVTENALIFNEARIFNHAQISGNAIIGGSKIIPGNRIITEGVYK